MMPPLLTGDPYQDRINMEDFKVKEKSFNTALVGLQYGTPVQDVNGTGFMAMPSGNPYLDDGPAGGQGIMGGQDIRQYLTPFLQQIQQENQSEMQQKIEPYVQEVQQITDRTFPNFTGFGTLGGLGGQMDNRQSYSNISQAMGSRSNFARPVSDIGSNPFIQSRRNMVPYQLSTK